MALINCPECKKEVSDQSISCPNCGYPIRQNSIFSSPPPLPSNNLENLNRKKQEEKTSPIVIIASILALIFIVVQCSSTDSPSTDEASKITSSRAVGGEFDTMQECRNKLDLTAKKYNVTYTVTMDERNYFSGKIVKDGIQSNLLVVCDKKDDYYQAMFEIPDE